jgi:hypothetical protein
LRRTEAGRRLLDRRARGSDARANAKLLARLDRQARQAERQGHAEQAEPVKRHTEPERPLPRPKSVPGPTRADIDRFAERAEQGDQTVTGELWDRFAAHLPSERSRQRALAEAVAAVADAWQARRAGR